ncbi:MAG: hypothetical protein H0V37_08495 [Chloroflexia bacterium]|nr:hypothetical protein [Chloroflexia bacterium]
MNPLALLLPIMIALTWARLIRPGLNTLQGTPLLVVALPLLARIRMHAIPALAALGLALVLAVRGDIAWWLVVVPAISNVLLVALPVKYTLTDLGIRVGWTSFRRWTEFAGVRRAPGGARLVGVQRRLGLQIWLSGSRGDDEFLQFLRQTVRNAYQGKASVIPFPQDRTTANHAPDTDSFKSGISAFTADR